MPESISDVRYKDKFIAFIDILGFKKKVKASEIGTGLPLNELLEILQQLGSLDTRKNFIKNGPIVCPCSKYNQRDLDFHLTQISDCVIMSCEISPAGVINLIHECSGSVIRLMMKGIMCRGYISRGSIYHTENQIIGSGYQDTYLKEELVSAFKQSDKEKDGTPFVQIDPAVCDYVKDCGDKLVQDQFSRHVKGDGTFVALFPFDFFSHSFVLTGSNGQKFDSKKEKQNNNFIRLDIKAMIESLKSFVDEKDEESVRKLDYYMKALNQQIRECDGMDDIIDGLNSCTSRTISDLLPNK